jgi:hypothetical protein
LRGGVVVEGVAVLGGLLVPGVVVPVGFEFGFVLGIGVWPGVEHGELPVAPGVLFPLTLPVADPAVPDGGVAVLGHGVAVEGAGVAVDGAGVEDCAPGFAAPGVVVPGLCCGVLVVPGVEVLPGVLDVPGAVPVCATAKLNPKKRMPGAMKILLMGSSRNAAYLIQA